MTTPLRVLILRAADEGVESLLARLRREGFAPSWERAETAAAVRAALDTGPWDLVLADDSGAEFGPAAALAVVRACAPELPFVVVSDTADDERAAELMRAGANDVLRGRDSARLGPVVAREVRAAPRGAVRPAELEAETLAAIVLSADDGIIGEDMVGRIQSWNPAAERMYGWRAEEVLGRPVSVIVPADRVDETAAIMERVRNGEPIERYETERQRRDGTRLNVSITIAPVRDRAGRVIGASKIDRDITARKRTEQQLLDSERLLRATLDALSAHITILDGAGTIVAVNEMWRRVSGDDHLVRTTTDIGSNYLAVCDAATGDCAEDARAVAAGIRALLAGTADAFSRAYPCHGPTEQRWFLFRATRFDSGNGVRVVVAHENITDLKRGEADLRRQNESLRLLSEASALLLAATDPARMVEDLFARVRGHVGCDAFLNYRIEGSGLVLEAAGGVNDDARRALGRIELGQYVCGTTARTRRPVCVPNVRDSTDPTVAAVRSLGFGAYACFPLLAGDRVLGTLSFGSRTRDSFTGADLEFLQTVSHYVAATKERFRAESELRRTSDLLNAVADGTPDAVYVKDRDGRYLLCNRATARFVGRSVEQVIGRDDAALFEPDSARRVIEVDRRVMATGRMETVEHELTAAGATHTYLAIEGPYRDGAGNIIGVLGIARDITDRRRVEEELRESELRYRTLIETSSDAIFLIDHAGRIRSANPAAARMHGYTTDELQQMWIQDLDAPEDAAQLPDRMARLRNGEVLTFEVAHRRKDGTTFPLEVVASGVQIGGEWFALAFDRDIAERKLAETALRQSESRFRTLIEDLDVGVVLQDAEDRVLVVNAAAARTLGLTRDQSHGVTSRDPRWNLVREDGTDYPPDQVPSVVAARARRAVRNAIVGTVNLQTGNRAWLEVSANPHLNPDGTLAHVLVTLVDVTERKRAEAALRASEERLRLALAAGRMGTFDWDIGTSAVVWSDTHYELFGYPPGDRFPVAYRHFADRLHPDDRPACERALRDAMEGRRGYANESRILLPDGTVRWVMGAGEFHYDPAGRPVRMLGTVVDITDRKRAEIELQMRDRAIQAVQQGIMITDPARPDNPIVYASPGFERLTGYSAAEVRGRNCRFLQGKDTDRAEVARMKDAIRTETAYTGELLNYRKDGTPFWNELSITPVRDPDGRVVHFVGVQTDVTARRSLEDQLRQAQKMEAVGQLAGGVAHDFNNLLTIINGYCDMLLLQVPAGAPQREPLTAVRDAGERAAALTKQLLTFSRRVLVVPRVLDLNDVVGSITKMLRRLIGEDVTLVTVLAPNPCRTRIDPGQLEQVIMNLAVNARDAMLTGGRLTIETGETRLTAPDRDCPPGRYARLAVTDTGSGMTDEVKAHLFEPFFTTKGVGKGTGLGLAMVYGIVKQAGGHIRVASEVGVGTTFTILLPYTSGAADGTDGPSDPLAPPGTETILLVEDEDGVRQLARLVLETQGYTILETGSGGEARAVSAAHPHPIHLLVTDVVMPDLGGRQLADAIRAARPSIRVLYMSGYTDDALVRHGVAAETVAFLQKPFSPLALARKVREVLDAPSRPAG